MCTANGIIEEPKCTVERLQILLFRIAHALYQMSLQHWLVDYLIFVML